MARSGRDLVPSHSRRWRQEAEEPLVNADIPFHPALIEAGFLTFVEGRKGGELLFASLKADGRGRVYQRMQRRLSRLIRGVITDERAVPYSFDTPFATCSAWRKCRRTLATAHGAHVARAQDFRRVWRRSDCRAGEVGGEA